MIAPTEPATETQRDEEVVPPPSTEPKQDDKGPEPVEEAAASEDTQAEAETEEPEVAEEEESPKPRSGYARKKAENARLYARIAQLEAEKATKDAGQQEPQLVRPKLSDFPDFEKYEEAMDAYHDARTEQVAQRATAKLQEQQTYIQHAQEHQEAIVDFVEGAKSYSKKIPDFDQAIDQMYGSLGPLPPVLRDLIAEADNGHMVLYQMAKNPGLARDIYGDGPIAAAMKIGELNAKMSLPSARKETKAPPPISAPKGGATPPRDVYGLATKSEDIRDYVKARKAMKDIE